MSDKENGKITEYDSKQLIPHDNEKSVYLNSEMFDQIQRAAKLFAASSFVPDAFKNRVDNCVIALDMALKMRMHPMMLMQTMYIVHGKPGFEGKFVSALINNSGRYNDPLEYEWRSQRGKPDWGCRAFAIRKTTGKTVYGPWVDWSMVVAEGWNKPKGQQKSKWESMPEIMFHYRAASFFGKINDSDLLMGMQTVEELQDIDMQQTATGQFTAKKLSVVGGGSKVSYEPTQTPPEQLQDEPPQTPPEQPQDEPPPAQELPQESSEQTEPPPEKDNQQDQTGQTDDSNGNGEGSSEDWEDEFGTPSDHPLTKKAWFSMRAGSFKSGTGFKFYVHSNREYIKDISDKAFACLFDKFQKLYGESMPWGRHGEILNGADSEIADEKPQSKADILNSPIAVKLAELANKHPDHYKLVVQGRIPESIEQIVTWVEQINTMVVNARLNSNL